MAHPPVHPPSVQPWSTHGSGHIDQLATVRSSVNHAETDHYRPDVAGHGSVPFRE